MPVSSTTAKTCQQENMTLNKRRLNPRDPFVLDTRELGRQPGSLRTVHRDVPSPGGLGSDTISVADGASLVLDLRLQAVTEGVLVTGTVQAPVVGECGRCLDSIAQMFSVEVSELFAYPDSFTDATTDQDEVERLVDDLINLEPLVRDAIVLGLPITPLCRPDCGGLCPTCGQRLDELGPAHTHEVVDPRWAALAGRSSSGVASPPDRTDERIDIEE
jgi:uncharacterized protein